MDFEEKRRLIAGWRGRRLLAYRTAEDLTSIIRALGSDDGSNGPPEGGFPVVSEQMKAELENSVTVLLRMVLALNDGHVSSVKLRSW